MKCNIRKEARKEFQGLIRSPELWQKFLSDNTPPCFKTGNVSTVQDLLALAKNYQDSLELQLETATENDNQNNSIA
jgi:hypothetical protein